MAIAAHITRRLFLKRAPAVAAVASVPAVAVAAAPEDPASKCHRLCTELQAALAEFCDGQFMAEVYPANHPTERFAFNAVAYDPKVRLARLRLEIVAASKKAYPEVHDWRVLTPESQHMADSEKFAGFFMIVGHPDKTAA